MVKIIKKIAMELRLAKKPLKGETRPITAIRVAGRLIWGARKILSMTPCQVKKGRKACFRLLRYVVILKSPE